MSREASWVASQVAGVASQVARFVIDAGASVCVCGIAECDAGDVGGVISVVGGALFSSPSLGTTSPLALQHQFPRRSLEEILPVRGLRLWGAGSQDVPPVVLPVVSQVASQVASQGA